MWFRVGCRSLIVGGLGLSLVGVVPLTSQQTVPEATQFARTSSRDEVSSFLDSLVLRGALFQRGVLATSPEGRTVPYAIVSRPLVTTPAAAHRTGKPIIYLQGNIHGGEVEGKEALQMLLRDLTLGSLQPLLDSVVLLIAPVYNPDGNNAFGPTARNRRQQNGPDLIGLRPNGQGLDLNRDYVKQEAPETRGSAALINAWDPDVLVDLHTTDGSFHGYILTYAPGLNPNSPPANDYTRDLFLPRVRERMRARHGQEIFPYGNFRNQDPDSLHLGWVTYDARPRFGTNWMGMRGRLSILSEAYSHADFASRVAGTYGFVLEILREVVDRQDEIRDVIAASSTWRPDSIVLQAVLAPPHDEDVIAEITEASGDGSGGFARRRRTGVFRTVRMPVFDRFTAGRRAALPAGYLLPPALSPIAEALRRQGIEVARISAPWTGSVEGFLVDSLNGARFPFEGHRTVTVWGGWIARVGEVSAGWFWVPTAQRLGVLAAYLLEPASEDGFVTWNMLDRSLRRNTEAPILRLRNALVAPTVQLP